MGRRRHGAWEVLLTGALGVAPTLACGGDDESTEVGTEGPSTSDAETTDSETSTSGTTVTTTTTATGTTTGTSTETGTTEADILDQLLEIEGMGVEELDSPFESYRMFLLVFLQPQDHNNHDGPWFGQRMILTHRDVAEPMVLATSGYGLVGPGWLAEPTFLVASNQLTVEQRFFGPSIAEPADWSHLTIEQAANDHHRIVEALAPIYGANWIGTGASKGGMTSIYHRRFFPDDLDGTVAYVAPHNLEELDPRYTPFIDQLGDPECAQALKDLQAEALTRRETMIPLLEQYAVAEDLTFEHLGIQEAFEFNVIETRFVFWQYGGAGDCGSIPDAQASDQQIFTFLGDVASFKSFADAQIAYYSPYFYQAATQLGSPGVEEEHLGDLRLFPGEDTAALYAPKNVEVVWDGSVMPDVSSWLDAEGDAIMFLYGDRDPWTATAFDYGGATDTHSFHVSTGNHGSNLGDLPDAEFDEALAILRGWMGVDADVPPEEMAARRAAAPRWPIVRHAGL